MAAVEFPLSNATIPDRYRSENMQSCGISIVCLRAERKTQVSRDQSTVVCGAGRTDTPPTISPRIVPSPGCQNPTAPFQGGWLNVCTTKTTDLRLARWMTGAHWMLVIPLVIKT
jgi:hypothetical protein